jgi:hypothetical protein
MVRSRTVLPSLLPCLIVLATGCGLDDYKKDLRTQQELLKLAQEEEDVLGPPVQFYLPVKGSGSGTGSGSALEKGSLDNQFFFRAPKGISPARDESDKKKFFEGKSDLVGYYFVREPKADKKDCPFSQVLILSNRWEELAQLDKGSAAKIRTYDRTKILAHYGKKEQDAEPITHNVPRRQPLNLDHYDSESKAVKIYVCERGQLPAAPDPIPTEFVVVYYLDKAEDVLDPNIQHLVDVSLNTLGVGQEAVKQFATYAKIHKGSAPAPGSASKSSK